MSIENVRAWSFRGTPVVFPAEESDACAFLGLVVFGERVGVSPAFTSYTGWLGHPLNPGEDAVGKLVRKFLHCYGPATADAFASWLGCSGKQARRGSIIGIWTAPKKGRGIEVNMSLWNSASSLKQELHDLAEEYAAFRQQRLLNIRIAEVAQ
jgi:hypothetical protein